MMEEQRDFLLRQVQSLARGLGKFLGVEAIKDIIGIEQISDANLLDDEIETIVLMTKIEEIMFNRELTPNHLSVELGIPIEEVERLFNNERTATDLERAKLNYFVDNNMEFLQ